MSKNVPIPTEIKLHQQSKYLEITFESGEHFDFTCEFLRVFSPSAEVRGHTEAQAVLQEGKAAVNIEKIEPVGTYAVILYFDDGHNTGIYSWDWFYHLGKNQDQLWTDYLNALEKAGKNRFITSK
ncbi:gamma-butyrobetaine hydroxylase-like domain-containing protein [Beggiatoa alba]|nr:DUF971 domain-containing protein [Beggiatoa alba]